jgi:hypothetical protein
MSAITSSVIPIDLHGIGDHLVMAAVPDRQHVVWRMVLTCNLPDDDGPHTFSVCYDGVPQTSFYVNQGSTIVLDAGQVSWIRTPVNTDLSFEFSGNIGMQGSLRAETVFPS